MTVSEAVLARTAPLYARVRHAIPPFEWPALASTIDEIVAWKRRRNAIVLAHNYQSPAIYSCVADRVGDSLALARMASETDADVIVLAGVAFMAETAKLLNPSKTVLMPDPEAGCSLAASITAADIRGLRARYPGVPIIAYVNTTAAVKAEVDICCTSGNAKRVVEALGVPRVVMVPDEYLARNVAAETDVEVIAWSGRCEVHERFDAADVAALREAHPGVRVLAHPECPPSVVAAADYAGSTADMAAFVSRHRPARVALLTECSMSDNIAGDHPEIDFIRPCNLCPHMKRITLDNILDALRYDRYEVTIDAATAAPARRAVERMLAL